MNNQDNKNRSLLSTLLEKSFELWVRNRCNSIEKLKVIIIGENNELFKGSIREITLNAKRINFMGLDFKSANIKSGSIKIKLNPLSTKKKIKIMEEFIINGEIVIGQSELTSLFNSSSWKWLKIIIEKELFSGEIITGIEIDKNIVSFILLNKENNIKTTIDTHIKSYKKSILISSQNKDYLLPMDQAISIKEIKFNTNNMSIEANAIIYPD
tara:strand:- start:4669 stop:5304 length:636 start_codon:yes stop_codon:yes gene_type:complete